MNAYKQGNPNKDHVKKVFKSTLPEIIKVVRVRAQSCPTELCLTLCNPMDCSPPGSSVHGIL